MERFEEFDWHSGTEDEHLAMAVQADPAQLRELARHYDWSMYPEAVMGWVMAQACVDLGSALTAFFNGDPERFNYIPKRQVTEDYQAVAVLLDNIVRRVNSGFYLVDPGRDVASRKTLAKWLSYQEADRLEGRQGRYVLDEKILSTLLEDTLRLDRVTETAMYHSNPSLWRDLFSPVMDLGVSRRILRFKSGRR
jgi:hypothetical protein